MRAIIQRVKKASVEVEGKIIGKIQEGLLIFLAVAPEDTHKDVEYIAQKCLGLRIFRDDEDKMNLSVQDIGGEILVISQFTLYADVRKGKRPSFILSASPEKAELEYEEFLSYLHKSGLVIGSGKFGAQMEIALINDGPVTIQLDSTKLY